MSDADLRARWEPLRDRPDEVTAADVRETLDCIDPETGAPLGKAVLGTVENMGGLGAGIGISVEDMPWDRDEIRPPLFACFTRILEGPYDPELRRTAGAKLVNNAYHHQQAAAEAGLIGPLADLLSDDDPEIRKSAAEGLCNLAKNSKVEATNLVTAGAVEALSAARDDSAAAVREMVIAAAKNTFRWTDLGEPAREETLRILTAGIDDPDPENRKQTLKAVRMCMDDGLSASDLEAFEAVDTLLDRFDDDSDAVVTEACEVFGWLANKTDDGVGTIERVDAVDRLCAVIDGRPDPSPEQVEATKPVGAAVQALGKIGAQAPDLVEATIPRLLELPMTADVGTTAAPDALGKIATNDPSVARPAVANFATRIQEGATEAKQSAALNLGVVGEEAPAAVQPAVEALIELLDDDDTEVRTEAAVAIGRIANTDATIVNHALDPLIDALLAAPWERSERNFHSGLRPPDRKIARAIRCLVDGETDIDARDVLGRVVDIATFEDIARQRAATLALWAYITRDFTWSSYSSDRALFKRVWSNDVFDPLEPLLSHPDGIVRTRIGCILLRLDPSFSPANHEGVRDILDARLRQADSVPDDAQWIHPGTKVILAKIAVGMLSDIVKRYPERVEPLQPALEAATNADNPIIREDADEILDQLHAR